MKVLKKDGTLQDYNLAKIKLSIACASDEVDQPFTLSDIEILSRDIHRELTELNKDIVKSDEIHSIVYNSLNTNGFGKIAERYANYAGKTRRK